MFDFSQFSVGYIPVRARKLANLEKQATLKLASALR
jgi:hypothetical protein